MKKLCPDCRAPIREDGTCKMHGEVEEGNLLVPAFVPLEEQQPAPKVEKTPKEAPKKKRGRPPKK